MKSEIESMPMKSSNKNSQDVPSGYKRTEIGVIPKDWQIKELDQTSLIIDGDRGTNYPHAHELYPSGYCLFLNADNVTKKGFRFKECLFITKEKDKLLNKGKLQRYDLVLTTRGTVGNIAYYSKNIPFNNIRINSGMVILRCEKIPIATTFFYFFLKSDLFLNQIKKYAFGSAQPQLTVKGIKKLNCILPTNQEQKAIAEALSDVDSLIESLDKIIHKKKAIKKAAMQQLLTGETRLPGFTEPWETKRLGDFAEIIMGQSPSSVNYNTSGYGMPLIQGNADIINRKTVKRIYTTEVTKRGKHGDIIMSVRAPVGEISFATFDTCLGRGVCAIRYKNNFLYYYLISIEPKWSKWSKGSTFDSINSKEVKELPINIPPSIDEQKAIAKVLSDMDAEIEVLEKRKEKTEQMKQGMMQQLLTGKIRLLTPEGTQ